MGKIRNAYRIVVRKLQGYRPLGRPRCDRIILKWLLEFENDDWIHLA
jgi:hypothetical protein